MVVNKDHVYHVFNRGINKQLTFKEEGDYHKFLCLSRDHLRKSSDILAFCLMPNHFHFLIGANETSIKELSRGSVKIQLFSYSLSIMLSAYSQYFNKKYNRIGSLFSKGTKCKDLANNTYGIPFPKYLTNCLHYIHQNPLKSSLVEKLEDWDYSSFKDYAGLRNGTLCNKLLLEQLADLGGDFYKDSYELMEVNLPG